MMVAFSIALSGNEMKKRRKYQRLETEISLPDGKSSKVPKISLSLFLCMMVAFSSALSGNEMKKRRKYQRLETEKISLPDGKSSKVPKIKRILKWQPKITISNKLLKRIRDAYVRKMVRFAGCVVPMNSDGNPFRKYSEGSPFKLGQKPMEIPIWKCSYACHQ